DVRSCLGDYFAIEFQNEAQHTMGRRVRWPHVEDHSFPNVAQVFAGLRAGCGDPRPRIRRFYFAGGESHVATLRLCWQGPAVAQVQSRIRACQMERRSTNDE